MRTDVPVCRRCCFCLPLRYGLIIWGYLRLTISVLFFAGVSILFYGFLGMILSYWNPIDVIYTIILGFILVLTLTDVVLNIVFIVGGHKKNPKLLRAYYVYSFILCVLTALMGTTSSIYTLYLLRLGEIDINFHIWIILVDVATLLAQILIQAYVLLLVRSEIIKLKSNCSFRFVNNAAEAECTMKCGEVEYGEEGTEYSYERYAPDMYNK